MTSAFYAAKPDYQPPQPVVCRLTLDVNGLSAEERSEASVELWDSVPSLVTAKMLSQVPLPGNETIGVPVSATIVIRLADGRQREVSVYDALKMPEIIDKIAAGAEQEKPLLEWKTYAEVLERAQHATASVAF